MDDTVTDGHDAMPTEHSVAAPGEEELDGALMSKPGSRRPFFLTDPVSYTHLTLPTILRV